mmetsp:Transcript_47716/g.91175  ORF Transcript_47716/g.91175 Transcript_47716/m.91175 type:complete len:172 (+) Transcript_47716:150-665(+)|eukprot:CAMPEP_0114253070 /NCGR_PEP_ID=MMETSP0058-20121206/16190_1 /TAXON_ID=36894 /ORGANISM="Pyramimonas parkeae, CCMP726" /LENGTH=171 /DNA_ID=CAMNT_0001367079 /DNA_START=130 /DNA_END=645 /DNA_ORIENTATION=-
MGGSGASLGGKRKAAGSGSNAAFRDILAAKPAITKNKNPTKSEKLKAKNGSSELQETPTDARRGKGDLKAQRADNSKSLPGKKTSKKNDIDDIFATTKQVKAANAAKEEDARQEMEQLEAQRRVHPPAFESLSNTSREKTDDGLFIYSDKEMKVGLGADTANCPFDCWCCY